MLILEDNGKIIKIICTECSSILEAYKGEILERFVFTSKGVLSYKIIKKCPCCKTKNAIIKYEK